MLVVHNFTPVPRLGYRIGVPIDGSWTVALNSDADVYAGSNAGPLVEAMTEQEVSHGQPYSLVLDLPPLAALILRPEPPSPF
ncbi:1,4-alpha-glucan branching enzyme GlgB [compost metagenome]